jgi:hypothetical protein
MRIAYVESSVLLRFHFDWNLELGTYLELGAWNLELFA